jgi:hypothetical protein
MGTQFLGENVIATAIKTADSIMPMFTHFMSVSARVEALISVVCGLEQSLAMISYTIPAETRKATAELLEVKSVGTVAYLFSSLCS